MIATRRARGDAMLMRLPAARQRRQVRIGVLRFTQASLYMLSPPSYARIFVRLADGSPCVNSKLLPTIQEKPLSPNHSNRNVLCCENQQV